MWRHAKKAERLERALSGEGPSPHDDATRRLCAAAGALTPGPPVNAARRRAAIAAAVHAYRNEHEPTEDAGSRDGLDDMEIHRYEVELPEGGRIVVSDIESLSQDRLEKMAKSVADHNAGRPTRDRQR
jgi:hypothetical protein